MDFRQADGYASIFADAAKDTRNVWRALIMRRVSRDLDLARLAEPGRELRISARVRASHAPRRVNLHLNTQKTTDFHSHLMEFDLPEAGVWYPISMTTRDFEASPGDTVNSQLALMDWGLGQYRVDVDDFRVDVVDAQFPDVNFDGWSTLNEAGGTRLLNGRTLGLAVRPLGAIQASFLAREEAGEKCAARLLFNLEKFP